MSSRVYWITGLAGSGKSTLCRRLAAYLREQRKLVVLLDGDELRKVLHATTAYSRPERFQLALTYSHLCRYIALQDLNVAIATISLFREVQEWNRAHLPGYVEIFLDVPLTELARRVKELYAAPSPEKNIAGFNFPVDYPVSPEVHLRWHDGIEEETVFSNALSQLRSSNLI